MKVAFLMGSLNRGGTETLILDVLNNAAGCQLEAVCYYRKKGLLEAEFLDSPVSVKQLRSGRNILSYFCRLRKALRRDGVEVVHAQQAIDALYARLATLGTGIKVVLTMHGYDFTDNWVTQRIIGYVLGRTDATLYVSRTQREYYLSKYAYGTSRQEVVYNGISFSKLDVALANSSLSNLRNELGISADKLLLGSVGNFNAVRDQLTICKFLLLLKNDGVEFEFVFAGKPDPRRPDLYETCITFCQDNGLSSQVHFLGSRKDVPAILHQLDVFVYASNHDTFGIAVVEALAVGLPVVANDWGVMKELTEHGEYASLYKSQDERDLLQAYYRVAGDLSLRKNVASIIRKKYSIEQHIHSLQELYQSLSK